MGKIISLITAIFTAMVIIGCLFDSGRGYWKEDAQGIDSFGYYYVRYTYETKDIKMVKYLTYDDITNGGGLLYEHCDTLYIKNR